MTKLRGESEHLEVDAAVHREGGLTERSIFCASIVVTLSPITDEKQELKLVEHGETLLRLSEHLKSLIQLLKRGTQVRPYNFFYPQTEDWERY